MSGHEAPNLPSGQGVRRWTKCQGAGWPNRRSKIPLPANFLNTRAFAEVISQRILWQVLCPHRWHGKSRRPSLGDPRE